MSTRFASVSLIELAAAAPLQHVEAATIVREVVQRVVRDELPGVPSAHVIRVSPSGGLIVEGPIAADGSAVRRAAQLLEALLPSFDARVKVPGGLRLIIGRALGALDLPPYPSLDSFDDALSRFAAADPGECLREVIARRAEHIDDRDAPTLPASSNPAITVSDIRRARRATGVSLSEISRRCQVPMQLLRELEWGYLANWPPPDISRALVTGYARGAGLDEELVIRAVWPLLAEWVRVPGTLEVGEPTAPIVVDVPVKSVPAAMVTSTSLVRIERVAARRWDGRRIVAALTIPALLAIGAAPAIWQQHSAAARRAVQPPATASSTPEVQQPVRTVESQSSVRDTEVIGAVSPPPRKVERTNGGAVRQAAYRSAQPTAGKNKRPAAVKSAKATQPRKAVSRSKGPRKWGVWVLNKVGVRIISTEQQ